MQASSVQVLLFIYCIISIDTVCSCAKGWQSFGSSCYRFFDIKVNWEEARHACQTMNADLVVVKDQEEHAFIFNNANRTGNIWLGLTDIKKESDFIWIDNGECSNFSSFGSGEPNDLGGEDCTILITNWWNDTPCTFQYRFACEKYQDITPPSYGSSCPVDDIHMTFSATNRSVSVYWPPPTWTDDSSCHPTVTSSHSPGHVIRIPDDVLSASINVTYTATDKSGNSETCYFRVTASVLDRFEYPGLQIPVSSEYPVLTIGMFFVGIIVGVFGLLAALFCYNKVKRISQNRNHAYEEVQYTVKESTYAVTIKPDKTTSDYVNNIRTNKTTTAHVSNFKSDKTSPAYTNIKPNKNK
ncbi:uncharacterized protein LOC117125224 isoform X2 [Anneissia japonica]|uniref:uncharacterized protein LOC117125224 isoform X2 n=1 Tax=Anneissia japonica TaxID=1529436 RepID=UPI001425B9A3|nr:uncharacterized protein LOC117125224 isoform X2 [Anneissia japonica]